MQLQEADLLEMKEFYREELDKTLRRLDHIRRILRKIDPEYQDTMIIQNEEVKKGAGKPAKKKSTRRKKPGPKAIWGNYILKRLRQLDKPVTYHELIKDAQLFFKISDNKEKAVRQAIMNSAFRLRNKQGKIDTYRKPGTKEKYVGLSKWFDNEGMLLPEYKKRVG